MRNKCGLSKQSFVYHVKLKEKLSEIPTIMSEYWDKTTHEMDDESFGVGLKFHCFLECQSPTKWR
jgi:hypothetical protein